MIEEELRTVNEDATDSIMKRLDFLSGSQYRAIQGLLKDILSEEIVLFREKIRESLYGFDSQKGIRDVIDYVTERYLVSFDEVHSKTRKREVSEPRQIIHWMLRNHVVFNRLSLSAVGELVGSRDHATVLHSVREVNNWLATDRVFRERLMVMCNELGARTKWLPEKKQLLITGYIKQNETIPTTQERQEEHATS